MYSRLIQGEREMTQRTNNPSKNPQPNPTKKIVNEDPGKKDPGKK